MENGRIQSQYFWSTFEPSFASEDSAGKLLPLRYPNISKRIFISSPLSRKNTKTFCNIQDPFTRKHGGVTIQRGRIKFDKYYFIHTIPGPLSTFCKKILVQIFSGFAAIYHKGHFRNILTQISKLRWFSCYHSHIFKNLKLQYLMQNLMLNRLVSILNPKNEKPKSSYDLF